MIAVFQMTNPLWEFIIGPIGFASLGWWIRGWVSRYSDDPLGEYYETEEDYQ